MDQYHRILLSLSKVTPAEWCRGFFLLAAALVLAVAAMPGDAKTLLVDYGARKSTTTATEEEKVEETSKQQQRPPLSSSSSSSNDTVKWTWWNNILKIIDAVTTWSQVPHSWFGAFYLLSVACSLFWLGQYLTDACIFRYVASKQPDVSVTTEQVVAGWAMMFLQGSRRVYEHSTIIKPSKSTMWVVHWLLGLFFYLFINVSVWVEGSGALLNKQTTSSSSQQQAMFKLAIGIPLFLYAWINQYKCHKHLAGLKKYSLPQEGLFQYFVCAHYTCECLLYLSMAIAASPEGAWCNRTLLCAFAFVAVNLGVTASGTRKWYVQKFGIGPIANRWNMIPFVF